MKKLIAGLLVGLLGSQGAAMATPELTQEQKDHVALLVVVEQLGVYVEYDGQPCKQKPGLFGNYYVDGSLLNLCSIGDSNERMDTIRHEVWHVYQDLADCNLKDDVPVVAVFGGRGLPKGYKEHAAKYYEPSQAGYEAEAMWAAGMFSAQTIGNMLIVKGEECGVKFKF
jgi:hypothetical protein